ncbi:cryptochrome/photolyase family protein [Shimia biformata]|uniref:cryptochrome/photolyase family protein n=1 Tax=Shimia biformata TaxID=1294299 RepID=UPI001951D6F8|nr:deoxyribodipyrimidine photo-lyase [Shimia biformata]
MTTVIHWFRQDLRLADNPALCAAARAGSVLPVYILDDQNAGDWAMGAASRVWLHHSLCRLNESLSGNLRLFRGDPEILIPQIARDNNATAVFWTRAYEPWRMARDAALKADLKTKGLRVESHNGALLWEPFDVKKPDGSPYRVFSPFFRKGCRAAGEPRAPLAAPLLDLVPIGTDPNRLDLLPGQSWAADVTGDWQPGEAGARDRLDRFLEDGLAGYKEGRNFPAQKNVSRLSPHLHFGEISPNQVWHAARLRIEGRDLDHFLSELGWREFSHSLLFHNPDLPSENLLKTFDHFPWRDDPQSLRLWQRGQTGIPIVDAGMRELWQTGYMHNRVRMIVGSFLVKNLLIDWRHGQRWFWDTLFDADLANNAASWQWIAGSGADAAPYFRIFNPVTQGQKFDPNGDYTRHFVPEIAALPDKYLFNPWEAPDSILSAAGIRLGECYPHPIVDLKASRIRALDAYAQARDAASRHAGDNG